MQMQSYSSSTTPLLTDDEKENLIIIPTYSYDNKLNKELTEVCDYFRAKSWCESLSLFCFNSVLQSSRIRPVFFPTEFRS